MDKSKSRTYKAMACSIVVRLNGRAYSVGFDLGPGSIGVAVVALEPDEHGVLYPTELIFACSRIFPSSAGAQARRGKRGQRNAIRHKAHRMEKLWKLLAERDLMLPYSKDDAKDPARLRFSEDEIRKDPYFLRLSIRSVQIAIYFKLFTEHVIASRQVNVSSYILGDIATLYAVIVYVQTDVIGMTFF